MTSSAFCITYQHPTAIPSCLLCPGLQLYVGQPQGKATNGDKKIAAVSPSSRLSFRVLSPSCSPFSSAQCCWQVLWFPYSGPDKCEFACSQPTDKVFKSRQSHLRTNSPVTKYIWDAWDPRAQISYVFSVIPPCRPFVCKFRTITRITTRANKRNKERHWLRLCELDSGHVCVGAREYAAKCDEGQVPEQVKRNRKQSRCQRGHIESWCCDIFAKYGHIHYFFDFYFIFIKIPHL